MRHFGVVISTLALMLIAASWLRSFRTHNRVIFARFVMDRPTGWPKCELYMLISIDGRLMLHRGRVINAEAPGLHAGALPRRGWTVDRHLASVAFPAATLPQ